jgi:hypothetical protein
VGSLYHCLLASWTRLRGSVVNFEFELPPRRKFGHCIGQANEDTGIPFECAETYVENLAEQLRADAVVLIVPL